MPVDLGQKESVCAVQTGECRIGTLAVPRRTRSQALRASRGIHGGAEASGIGTPGVEMGGLLRRRCACRERACKAEGTAVAGSAVLVTEHDRPGVAGEEFLEGIVSLSIEDNVVRIHSAIRTSSAGASQMVCRSSSTLECATSAFLGIRGKNVKKMDNYVAEVRHMNARLNHIEQAVNYLLARKDNYAAEFRQINARLQHMEQAVNYLLARKDIWGYWVDEDWQWLDCLIQGGHAGINLARIVSEVLTPLECYGKFAADNASNNSTLVREIADRQPARTGYRWGVCTERAR